MHRSLLALLAAVALAAVAPAAAAAKVKVTRGPCGVGAGAPQCYFWTAKVMFIGDADTISVVLDGDKSKTEVRVRVTGINATEEYVHTGAAVDRVGECHAGEATSRLEGMIAAAKGHVRLSAQDPASHSGPRARRVVSVFIKGRWRDVGRTLLNEGHALWLPNHSETAWNTSYSIVAQRAAARQVGIWDPQHCGGGPNQAQKLKLWVNSDAPEEWVTIENLDPVVPVPVGGWWLRDSALHRYVIPAGATIQPNSSITVYGGPGQNTAGAYHWGLGGPIFDNFRGGDTGAGDGAYLFDPDGDLRAFMQYPCRWHCDDPLKGTVKLDPHPAGREWVDVTNISRRRIKLESYRLAAGSYFYPFSADDALAPGETMRIYMGGDPAADTPLVKNWGLDQFILPNGGGNVKVGTFDYVDIGCAAWGSGTC